MTEFLQKLDRMVDAINEEALARHAAVTDDPVYWDALVEAAQSVVRVRELVRERNKT